MNKIIKLRYVTRNGLEAPVDSSHPDCPFVSSGIRSKHGLRVINSGICKLRWEWDGILHELCFDDSINAVKDPATDLIVVRTGSMGAETPNNALVFNPDGSINHQIIVPPDVEQVIEQLPNLPVVTKRFAIERIAEVLLSNGRVLVGMGFRYEWVERRYYDPAGQRWQERDLIYRN